MQLEDLKLKVRNLLESSSYEVTDHSIDVFCNFLIEKDIANKWLKAFDKIRSSRAGHKNIVNYINTVFNYSKTPSGFGFWAMVSSSWNDYWLAREKK